MGNDQGGLIGQFSDWWRRRALSKHHPIDYIVSSPDPLMVARAELMDWGDGLHVGMHPGGWVKTEPRQNLLVLGPPQSPKGTGKTSSVLIPLVATATGPVVCASTRGDVLIATALVRSRVGDVWHFAPDGRTPTPPGVKQLRWSPIAAARTWDDALLITRAMVKVADGGQFEDGKFWTLKAADLLAPLLYVAAQMGKDMAWVRDSIRFEKVTEAVHFLRRENHTALGLLTGADDAEPRLRGSIFATASTVIRVYDSDAAVASSRDTNFDSAVFVSGRDPIEEGTVGALDNLGIPPNPGYSPNRRKADTIYITSSGNYQEFVAPLVVGLLMEIRQARYALHGIDESAGIANRAPVTFALDELAGIAPIPDLPDMLSDCGSQGLVIAACLQDLSQGEKRWGVQAEGFLTTFQYKLIFPGIANTKSLQSLSLLAGKYMHREVVYSEGESWGWFQPTQHQRGTSETVMERDILPPSLISHGKPGEPDTALLYVGTEHVWIRTTPYYRAMPWPWLLAKSMEKVASEPPAMRCLLPLPALERRPGNLRQVDRSGELETAYREAKAALTAMAKEFQQKLDNEQSAIVAERQNAEDRGDEAAPLEKVFGGGAYIGRLVVGGRVSPEEIQGILTGFDPIVENTSPEDWRTEVAGKAVFIRHEDGLMVPDAWVGKASRSFGDHRPETFLCVGCYSQAGWRHMWRFARTLARHYPVMWFPIGEGSDTDEEVGRLAILVTALADTPPSSAPDVANGGENPGYPTMWNVYTAAELSPADFAAVVEGFGPRSPTDDGGFRLGFGGALHFDDHDFQAWLSPDEIRDLTDELFEDLSEQLGANPRSCVVTRFFGPMGKESISELAAALAVGGPVVVRDDRSDLERIGG